uniref:RNase H type-1 domain-containing protein n=1 Tax=Cannabis sativa TaxID=3483 RepID=A0A803QJD9_CANSA
MGFHDLEDFNQSLLAKQGWKLLTTPDCFLARVLKAFYFPNDSFFEAKLGHFGSSVWSGILWGKDLLMKGSRWCVGDGRMIRINEDSWIPRSFPFTLRNKIQIPPEVTINTLLHQNGNWKVNEVVFNHWIPTKVELVRRGMALDTCCDWCKNQEEDICHALWLCPKVQNVWKKLGFSKLIPPDVHKAADVLWWLLDHLPKDDLIRVMGLSWLVWQRRNSFVFQHKAPDDHLWTNWALDLLALHLGPNQQVFKIPAIQPFFTWQSPPKGYFLINTDASLEYGQAGCGLSAVIRDSDNFLVVAEVELILGCLSVLLVEAAAILLGVKLALRWPISNAQVGSDSQSIVKALKGDVTNPTN